MQNVSKSMVTKSEQDAELADSERHFAELRSEINILEKKDFAVLKGQLERIVGDVELLKGSLREEVGRVHGGARLDINLEKARIQDEAASLREMVKKAEERIDTEIAALTDRMIQIRDGTRKSLQQFMAIVFVAFCSYKVIGYNRNS
ncbi:hypothetical protein HK104_009354 [Borealophlyctis nickersoniae]|nr:hypothetical protein HK104_009354 [Borealophlyctis nickersoniae]